ncbi:MAG: hypothetical protein HC918_06230 [Oscillatoriales cyanobacterium SM2_1_8]|nr:hypothetical protein [Oscillatoriales cyanobacterium SM2_1_8]
MADPSSPQSFVVKLEPIRRCHIRIPDHDRPVPAVEYRGEYYSFFRFEADWMTTEKIARRLSERYLITPSARGWAIWTYEY